jgi:hypothetical protein
MKHALFVIALFAIGCAGAEPTPAASPGTVPSSRCPFGVRSYPSGERVCDHGHEFECRVRIELTEPGWHPTGKNCEAGEPPATSS